MVLGLWGRMRKRREEKKQELERIREEKRTALERMQNAAWADFAAAREAQRQKGFQQDMEALKVSSLDARRDRMQGVLTARRAYLNDENRDVYQSDSNMIAAQQFIQSVTESASSSDSSGCSSSSDSGSSSSDSGSSGSCGGD